MLAAMPLTSRSEGVAATTSTLEPPLYPLAPKPGERVPSDDPILKDFHSLGLVNGTLNLYRCASPVRDLGKKVHDPADLAAFAPDAKARLQHLKDLGIQTIISLEDPGIPDSDKATPDKTKIYNAQCTLEKAAAADVGLTFISHPMNNKGPNSFQTMTDDQVHAWLEAVTTDLFAAAAKGGVVFHCSAGHDRTGIVTAYIRIKYQHWPVSEAIDEMRRFGHNWPKYSNNDGVSSWHEDHLRAIAATLEPATTAPASHADSR